MSSNFPEFKPTPALLRKCAVDLSRQEGKYGQVSYTRGGDALVEWFRYNADTDSSVNVCWAEGSTMEKYMLCLFFAEFLEGEPA